MSEMIERIARAMFDAEIAGTSADMAEASWAVPGHRERWEARARTAIEAMREPTEAMIIAAYDTIGPGFCDEPADAMDPTDAWSVMIDAAIGS